MRSNDSFYLEKLEFIVQDFKRDRKKLFDFLENSLERIKHFDPIVNSYTNINYEVLIECQRVKVDSIFYGLPFAVKDLIDTREIFTTYGSPFFLDHMPENDAKIISLIKKNGGTIIGKTNTHQFALGIISPPTKNPWDLSRIPGGSSGGSAAAVAAGLSVLSIGTDTGGSIRLPAAMCGVTGFKPSYGKISMEGVFPESFSEDHVGPICRFASDLRLVVKGLGMKNISTTPKKMFRVGIINEFFEESDRSIKATTMKSINKLESEGVISEIRGYEIPNLEEIRRCHDILDRAETHFHHSKKFLGKKLQYPSDVKEEIDAGTHVSAQEYIYALKYKHYYKELFNRSMIGIDLLVSPTVSTLTPTIVEATKMKLIDHFAFTKFLTPFNYLGVPSITIPCGFITDLPVGLQAITNYEADAHIIDFATQFQNFTDWHKKMPNRFI